MFPLLIGASVVVAIAVFLYILLSPATGYRWEYNLVRTLKVKWNQKKVHWKVLWAQQFPSEMDARRPTSVQNAPSRQSPKISTSGLLAIILIFAALGLLLLSYSHFKVFFLRPQAEKPQQQTIVYKLPEAPPVPPPPALEQSAPEPSPPKEAPSILQTDKYNWRVSLPALSDWYDTGIPVQTSDRIFIDTMENGVPNPSPSSSTSCYSLTDVPIKDAPCAAVLYRTSNTYPGQFLNPSSRSIAVSPVQEPGDRFLQFRINLPPSDADQIRGVADISFHIEPVPSSMVQATAPSGDNLYRWMVRLPKNYKWFDTKIPLMAGWTVGIRCESNCNSPLFFSVNAGANYWTLQPGQRYLEFTDTPTDAPDHVPVAITFSSTLQFKIPEQAYDSFTVISISLRGGQCYDSFWNGQHTAIHNQINMRLSRAITTAGLAYH